MMARAQFGGRVWVGSSLGILKGISLFENECINYLPSGTTLVQTDRTKEVMCMCWGGDNDKLIYLGLKNGCVQCFDSKQKYFCSECDLSGDGGHFVGLGRHDKTLITCSNEGALSFWPDSQEKCVVDVGGDVCSMSCSPNEQLLVATGGKENDLKLWDGSRPEAPPIFKARNIPHDYLDLRVPIWVTATGFVPGSSGRHPLVAVATGYHQLRLYDTRAQRRPVYNHSWGAEPFSCMDVTGDGRYFLVGTARGAIARVDVRKGSVVSKYHGFGGGVKSISCYNDSGTAMFAACGLDRYLRVYTMDPPTVVYKKYLKLTSNCLLVLENSDMDEKEEISADLKAGSKRPPIDATESCDDELWDNMDQVKDEEQREHKTRRKKIKR